MTPKVDESDPRFKLKCDMTFVNNEKIVTSYDASIELYIILICLSQALLYLLF